MDNTSRSTNSRQKIAGVRLVYGSPPAFSQDPLETMDYCTRLVMQLKEDELLYGGNQPDDFDLHGVEDMGIVFVEDEDE